MLLTGEGLYQTSYNKSIAVLLCTFNDILIGICAGKSHRCRWTGWSGFSLVACNGNTLCPVTLHAWCNIRFLQLAIDSISRPQMQTKIKKKVFFFLSENLACHFIQTVFFGVTLNELSSPVFKKKKMSVVCCYFYSAC